ncbi:hypothetical protein LCGC14_2701670, partial [marine sediment metagenome]
NNGEVQSSEQAETPGEVEEEPEAAPPEVPQSPYRTRMLERYDADGDGKLSDSEREKAFEEMGERRREQRLARFDTDGDGEYEFGFGELRNSLTGDQPAALESGPRNLGQLVSAGHHEENGGAGGVTAQGGGQGNAFGRDHGQGKPQEVPPDGGGE